MANLKPVSPKMTAFSEMTNSEKLQNYLDNCITKGSAEPMFEDPHISNTFYGEGTDISDALKLARKNYKDAPIESNLLIKDDKMSLAKLWLKDYASKVMPIANDPMNCTTREEAATNITLSGLMAQKLGRSAASPPETPVLIGLNIGVGMAKIDIVNGSTFHPKETIFVAVSKAPITIPPTPDAVVTLVEGQLKMSADYKLEFFLLTIDGKGKTVIFKELAPNLFYEFYAFSKDGKKLVSALSAGIPVKG